MQVQRRVVLTKTGTYYALGTLDAEISKVMAVIAPNYDPSNPLSPDYRAHLFYAEKAVYGAAAAPLAQLLASLDLAEQALGFSEVVAPPFMAIRQILGTMGVTKQGV